MNRSKKQNKVFEEPYWDCSVCTYRNAPEAFKCLMCDIRKGTSTRKPKVNVLASQHAVQQYNSPLPKPLKREDESKDKDGKRKKKFKKTWRPSKLKNVDRSTAQARDITINNITIQITEYKVKEKRSYDAMEQSSTSEMSSHSESGFETSSTAATTSSGRSHSFL